MKDSAKGLVAIIACYVIWGVLPIFWKLLSSVDSLYVMFNRCLWSFVICMPLYLILGKKKDMRAVFRSKRTLILTLIAGILAGLNWAIYIYAVSNNYIVEASLGYYINPLMISSFGFVLFKERFNKLELSALLLAAVAVLYFALKMHVVPWISIVIAVVFATYGAVKKLSRVESGVSMSIETLVLLPFALTYIIYSEVTGNGVIGVLPTWQLILFPLCGVVTLVPMLLFGYGVSKMDYSICGMLLYINPTLQLLIGVFLYNESFTYVHLITFLIIWASVVLFILGQRKKHAEAATLAKTKMRKEYSK